MREATPKAFDRFDEHLHSFYVARPLKRGRRALRDADEYSQPGRCPRVLETRGDSPEQYAAAKEDEWAALKGAFKASGALKKNVKYLQSDRRSVNCFRSA